MRVAAIDVGTNSVHLLVADVHLDGTWTIVEKAREQVELGANGLDQNRISPRAFERGMQAMRNFRDAIRSLTVSDVHCAATSAVREAENGEDWCRAVREETGIRVRAVSGAEEGHLIYLGARTDLDFSRGRVLLVDLGGGSTEFILCDSERTNHVESLPLGHIRLAEAFHRSDPMGKDEYERLKSHVKETLRPVTTAVRARDFTTLVGTSGTLRCLALMATLARGEPTPHHAHGLVLRRDDIEQLVKRLRSSTFAQLATIPGMDPKRQRTITVGAVLVRQVMRSWDAKELVTSERSLRDGLINDWILRNRPEIDLMASVPDPRERSIRRLLVRFGGGHEAHGEVVRKLALQLFDDLAPIHRLGFVERELLSHAARVHDIGHHISGKNHNKHGQYLIRHTRLHGFTMPEIGVLGNIVRYHRGSKPKTQHGEFAALSVRDRRVVRVLAGILRLADGLDRSHTQPVTDVRAELGDGVLKIEALAHAEAHLERWAVKPRKDLLESTLRQEVRVVVRQVAEPALTLA